MENLFKSQHYVIPGHIKAGAKNVRVEWLFDELTKDKITKRKDGSYAIYPGCGCTASIDVLDDRLLAMYTDGTKKEDIKGAVKSVGKNVRVFIEVDGDEEPLMIKNQRGVLVPNTKKSNALLTFAASIVR